MILSIPFFWLVCCIDGNTINELRLVLHALALAACQFCLVLLPVRRGTLLIVHSACTSELPQDRRNSVVQVLEGVCEACQSALHLLDAGLSLCVAVSHILKGVLFLVLSTVRLIQRCLLCADSHEMWEKEREEAQKHARQMRAQVEEYLSLYPIISVRERKMKNFPK